MNRYIFILIIFISGLFIQGNRLSGNHNREFLYVSDTSFSSWKEELSSSYGIPEPAIQLALNGYFGLKNMDLLKNDTLLTIIDFNRPSSEKRLFILDLKNQRIIKNTLVAHGMRSGVNIAESFSNKRHSNKSSLGLYITNETYFGKHAYSLRLDGMSYGLNDNARKRAIVVHGADYVNEGFISKNGRIGRSFGCPAIANEESEEIINLIKGGSCLFIYHPTLIPISQSDLEKLP
ncbi:MAG: hypothetical protein GQ564_14305 [Bacteroidales bacterium]|nr:hypothetical protein [Bacteroidales bacterium]